MGGPSPRYLAEHFIMPRFLRERGASACLDAIAAKDDAFFIPVWFEAGFQFRPMFLSSTHGPYRIGIMTFPRPRESTEAYVGVVVGRADDPAFLRYFLWEESISFTGEPATVLGEWDAASKHLNYGAGPKFSGSFENDIAELTRQVVAILG
jgi:hypothetical protein